jgi:outer membrane biosynthesis protein TonB
MATLIKHLTSISPNQQSGGSAGRRLLATALCAMLVLSSILPGVAFAGETDSEGEGTSQPVEAPIPPNFDPGGEETALEEAPASEDVEEEGGVVEVEPEADAEVPATNEVTSAAVEGAAEESPSQPVEVQPLPAAPEPEPVEQEASESAPSEPAANESLVAPKQKPVRRSTSHEQPAPVEATAPAEPTEEEAPSPASPVPATPAESGRNLQGKNSYVVRPGDCLWHIAADLLPAGADTAAIEAEVARLWRLNEDRIGTGNPSLIYAGTTLRLH